MMSDDVRVFSHAGHTFTVRVHSWRGRAMLTISLNGVVVSQTTCLTRQRIRLRDLELPLDLATLGLDDAQIVVLWAPVTGIRSAILELEESTGGEPTAPFRPNDGDVVRTADGAVPVGLVLMLSLVVLIAVSTFTFPMLSPAVWGIGVTVAGIMWIVAAWALLNRPAHVVIDMDDSVPPTLDHVMAVQLDGPSHLSLVPSGDEIDLRSLSAPLTDHGPRRRRGDGDGRRRTA